MSEGVARTRGVVLLGVDGHVIGVEAHVSIGVSGSRVLPQIARNSKRLDVIDLSSEQLALIELRHAAARALTRDEFLFFLGYRGGLPNDSNAEDSRRDLFRKLGKQPPQPYTC